MPQSVQRHILCTFRTGSKPGGIIVNPVEQTVETPQTFQAGRVVTVASAHMLHDMYTSFLAPLLPVFMGSMALSKTQAGLLMVFWQGPSLLQPLVGHLADRINLRYLVFLSPALAAVIMSMLGVAPNYAIVALLLTVLGISSASFHAVASVMAGNLSGRRLGLGTGLWMFGAEFGRTIGPLLVVTAIRLLTLRGLPWLMIIGLLGATMLYIRLRDVPFRPAHTGEVLPWRQALKGMERLMLPLVGIIVARAFVAAALSTYLPTFLREEGADLWLAGASLSVYEAAGTVGALLGGWLSDQLGRRTMLFISLVAAGPLMLLFLSTNGWMRLLSLLLLGFAVLSNLGVIMAMVQESHPQNRALANGVYLALAFLSNSGMSVIVGALGDLFGLRLAFTAAAFAPLLGSALVLLLPRQNAQSALPQQNQA